MTVEVGVSRTTCCSDSLNGVQNYDDHRKRSLVSSLNCLIFSNFLFLVCFVVKFCVCVCFCFALFFIVVLVKKVSLSDGACCAFPTCLSLLLSVHFSLLPSLALAISL